MKTLPVGLILAALVGCASQHQASMAVMSSKKAEPAQTFRLITVAEDGTTEYEGEVAMTPSTQAFLKHMKISGYSLNANGTLASWRSLYPAPADLPEGYEESYSRVVFDRFGNIVDSDPPEIPPAACVRTKKIVDGHWLWYCKTISCQAPSACTLTQTIDPDTGLVTESCDCYNPNGE